MTNPENQLPAEPDRADNAEIDRVEPVDSSPLLYQDLAAPTAIDAEPPPQARWIAFASIVVAGLLGGLIGYGTADLMSGSSVMAAVGALLGAIICAGGVGIVASLTLRAMNEWRAVEHPESETRASSGLVLRSAAEQQADDEDDDPADRSPDPEGRDPLDDQPADEPDR